MNDSEQNFSPELKEPVSPAQYREQQLNAAGIKKLLKLRSKGELVKVIIDLSNGFEELKQLNALLYAKNREIQAKLDDLTKSEATSDDAITTNPQLTESSNA